MLKLKQKKYNDVIKKAGKFGWSKCSTLRNLIIKKNSKGIKGFCVNVTKVTEWNFLENDVVKDAKCLTIVNWRGIRSTSRAHFTEKTTRSESKGRCICNQTIRAYFKRSE